MFLIFHLGGVRCHRKLCADYLSLMVVSELLLLAFLQKLFQHLRINKLIFM